MGGRAVSSASSGRAEDARVRAELAAGSARYESERAQVLIDSFIAKAMELGIDPEPLRAHTFAGAEVKTDKVGWYIRKNKSIGVGTDGGYYQLTVPGSGGLLERLRGVKLAAAPPPLVVGRGGRDGETGDLVEFLDRVLAQKN
jgi:hypothetical protein